MARNYNDDKKKGNDSHRDGRHGHKPSRRHQTVTTVTSGQLPKWVRDEIMRSLRRTAASPRSTILQKQCSSSRMSDIRQRCLSFEVPKSCHPVRRRSESFSVFLLIDREIGRKDCAS